MSKVPFGTRFFNGVERFFGAIGELGASKGDAFIDVLGVHEKNETVFYRSDLSLFSVFEIRGLTSAVAGKSYMQHLARVEEVLGPYVSKPGHSVQFVFKRDHQGFERLMDEVYAPVKETLNRLNVDWDWLLDSRKRALEKYCSDERVWLVVETNTAWASKELSKMIAKENSRQNSKDVVFSKEGLTQIKISKLVLDRHVSACESIKEGLRSTGLMIDLLNHEQALKIMRNEIDPGFTPPNWKPKTKSLKRGVRAPDAPVSIRDQVRISSALLPPELRRQIMPRMAQYVENDNYVRIGSRTYAPIIVTMPPVTPKSFGVFIRTLISMGNRVPVRMSISLKSNALSRFGIKRVLASFKWARVTREMSEALKELSEMEANNKFITGLSITLTTWVDDRDDELRDAVSVEALLTQRAQMVLQAVENWGQMEASDVSGMPVWAVSATVPGLTNNTPAPESVAPLEDVSLMLPVDRPGSPWRYGSMLLRSKEGKLMPFQAGSSLQTSWSMIAFAPPGSGKSVLLSSLMLSLIMSPGQDDLPWIGILDIGPSSRGLIDLLRNSLPPGKKELAKYIRFQNTSKYAVNPFDLPLGFDEPFPSHKDFLTLLLSLLVADRPNEPVSKTIIDLLTAVIDVAYREFSRGENPKLFDEDEDPELTQLIYDAGISIDAHTTWWEIVDALFEKEMVDAAIKAQTHAMPTLGDVASLLKSSSSIEQRFTMEMQGQKITDYVYSQLRGAIQRYPVISTATRFSLGNARVVAMNLEDVCPQGGDEAGRQTAVMYILMRQAFVSRLLSNEEEFMAFSPTLYKHYHAKRIEKVGPEMKMLALDEFHRTRGAIAVRDMVEQDMRLGRKYNYNIALFSQNPNDFSGEISGLAMTTFVLSEGRKSENSNDLQALKGKLGLTDTDVSIIASMDGPSRVGAMVYLIAKMKSENQTRMLTYNTLGPIEMWALETNAMNRALREKVVAILGIKDGLKALAYRFPSGSAVDEIEKYKESMSLDMDEEGSVIEHFVEQVIDAYRKQQTER